MGCLRRLRLNRNVDPKNSTWIEDMKGEKFVLGYLGRRYETRISQENYGYMELCNDYRSLSIKRNGMYSLNAVEHMVNYKDFIQYFPRAELRVKMDVHELPQEVLNTLAAFRR